MSKTIDTEGWQATPGTWTPTRAQAQAASDVDRVRAVVMASPCNGGIGPGGIKGATGLSEHRVRIALETLALAGDVERWTDPAFPRCQNWRPTIAAIRKHRDPSLGRIPLGNS